MPPGFFIIWLLAPYNGQMAERDADIQRFTFTVDNPGAAGIIVGQFGVHP